MFEKETDWGRIRFSKNVVYQICKNAVDSCDGAAAIMNYKGKGTNKGRNKGKGLALFQARRRKIDTDDIVIEETEKGLLLTVYVAIRFGTSIAATAEKILDLIAGQMEEMLNVRPLQVKLINTATVSTDLVPRHMEFIRAAEAAESAESAADRMADAPAEPATEQPAAPAEEQ